MAEVVSRALWQTATRGATLVTPQHPKPMRMKKGNHGFRDRESNSQTGTEYIPTRLDNSNADLGTERMEPVPTRIAEQQQKQAERERKRASEKFEGRRGGGHGTRGAGKGRSKKEGDWQAEGKRRLAVYTEEKRHLFRAQHPRNQHQSINSTIRSKTTSIKAQ